VVILDTIRRQLVPLVGLSACACVIAAAAVTWSDMRHRAADSPAPTSRAIQSPEYEQWLYEYFSSVRREYERKGQDIPTDVVPFEWEVPPEHVEDIRPLWVGQLIQPSEDNGPQPGCFLSDGSWSTDAAECDEVRASAGTADTPTLQRTSGVDQIPASTLLHITNAAPPPQPSTAADRAAVLAIMRKAYITNPNASKPEQERLWIVLGAVEQRMKDLQRAKLPASVITRIDGVAAWATAERKTVTGSTLMETDHIHEAVNTMRRLLTGLQPTINDAVPDPMLAPEIRRHIDVLLLMADMDIPQILAAYGLALPPSNGVRILELREADAELRKDPCWSGNLLCPAVDNFLQKLQDVLDDASMVTEGHQAARDALVTRYRVLIGE
jgi:hypothetical protein